MDKEKLVPYLNFALLVVSAQLIQLKYTIFVSIIVTILIILKVSLKYMIYISTVILYLFSDLIWQNTDPQLEINKINFFQVFENISIVNSIISNTLAIIGAVTLCYLIKKLFIFLKFEKIISNLLFTMVMLFLSHLVFFHTGKIIGYSEYALITFYLLFCLFAFRSMNADLQEGFNALDFIKKTIPPFFDNGWFVRTLNYQIDGTINLKSKKITMKLVLFILIYLSGKIAKAIFYENFNGKHEMLNILDFSQVPINFLIGIQYSKLKILFGFFLQGWVFISLALSITLLVESVYIAFGYTLKSEFNYQFKSRSFSQYLNSVLPMQTEFIKEFFLFPFIEKFIFLFSRRKLFFLMTYFSILFAGSSLHFIRNFYLFGAYSYQEVLIRSVQNDFFYFTLITIAVFVFRKIKTKRFQYVLALNIFFITFHGFLIFLKRNFMFVSDTEKFKILGYLVGIY